MGKAQISTIIGKLSKAEQAKWLKERKKSRPDVDWDEGMEKFGTKELESNAPGTSKKSKED